MVRRVHLAIARALVRFLGPALEEREVDATTHGMQARSARLAALIRASGVYS